MVFLFWSYLSHFRTDFDGAKAKLVYLIGTLKAASLSEMLRLAIIFWPYLNHFKPDLDGIKSKIGLLK